MRAPHRMRAAAVLLGTLLLTAWLTPPTSPLDPTRPTAPVPFAPEILLRDGAWTLTPSISVDGSLMAFVRWVDPKLSGPESNIQHLYLSRRGAGAPWEEPHVVEAFADYRVDFPHFSPDGRWLYLSSTRPHPSQCGYPRTVYEDFDLWRVPLRDGVLNWDQAGLVPCADCNQPKGPGNWNVRYVNNETSPRLDTNGNLYFWGERAGTGGWRDVYLAPAEPDTETFGRELRLPFNTAARESGVAVTRDGRTVVFASERAGGSGASDLYRVARTDMGWTAPEPLGAHVNTVYSEQAPELVGDTLLLYTSDAPVRGYTGADAGEGNQRISVFAVAFEP